MGLKVHLYLIEKDEMEKKDPEVKAQKTSRYIGGQWNVNDTDIAYVYTSGNTRT